MRAGYASVGRYATIVAAPIAIAYGLLAVGVASRHGTSTTYAGLSPGAAAAELTAGWALAGAGIAAWWRRPGAPAGPLALLGAFAWFSPDWIGWQTGRAGPRDRARGPGTHVRRRRPACPGRSHGMAGVQTGAAPDHRDVVGHDRHWDWRVLFLQPVSPTPPA